MDNMHVAQKHIELTEYQWEEIEKHCCFSHKEACEYILYVPREIEYFNIALDNFQTLPQIQDILKEAHKKDFKYICLYT